MAYFIKEIKCLEEQIVKEFKQIHCQLCNGIWFVDDQNLSRQIVCPYCDSPIQGKIEFNTFDSLDKAIYHVVEKRGISVFKNMKLLVSFMMDIAPNLHKEIRIFSKAVTDKYTGIIESAFNAHEEELDLIVKKLRHLIIDEEGLSSEWAETICVGIQKAVFYYKGDGTSVFINVDIEDFPIINESNCSNANLDNNFSQKITIDEASKCKISKNNHSRSIEDWLSYISTPLDSKPAKLCDDALKYYNGISYYSKDERQALKLLREAAYQYQYLPAFNYLGRIYMKKRIYDKAIKCYTKSFEAGDIEGICMMGYFYLHGFEHYGVKNDSTRATELFERVASAGELEILVLFSKKFFTGGDVPKEDKVGYELLNIAAREGNSDAQRYMARIKRMGGYKKSVFQD